HSRARKRTGYPHPKRNPGKLTKAEATLVRSPGRTKPRSRRPGQTARSKNLSLRTEERNHADGESIHAVGIPTRTARVEVLVGPIMTIFNTREEALHPLVLVGECELLQRLRSSGGEPVAILEPLKPRRQGNLARQADLGGGRDAIPFGRRAGLAR